MAKPGQAKILNDSEYKNLRAALKSKRHRLLFDILHYTGERVGAVVQLQVNDCYLPDLTPKESILFRAPTRKANPNGKRETREVPLHPALRETLKGYKPPSYSGWLFPCRTDNEACLTARGAAFILETAVKKAKYQGRGISTHSFRRSAITRMSEGGIDVRTIQLVIGHKSLVTTQRYIEANPRLISKAICVL